jgi:hypothetical protein
MNNTAIDYTARIAAGRRADIAADIRAARDARRFARPEGTTAPAAPTPRRHVWGRWLPSARPAH